MPRLSHNDYMAMLESVRTAMLRGSTDAEIMKDKDVSRRTLQRYKKAIQKRGLKSLPETTEEQRALFNMQVERWRDIIRQANKMLESDAVKKGGISPTPLLRVINNTTKNITEYSMKVGILPTAPVKVQGDFKVIVEMFDDQAEVEIKNKADGNGKDESGNSAS